MRLLFTGNDFRATEACAHTYASKDGRYTSLTHCSTDNGIFRFWLDLPISVGVVGGLTNLHPLVKFSLALLGKPSATELMSIIVVSGLAQNFCSTSFPGNYRYTKRTYENALVQYPESVRCNRS